VDASIKSSRTLLVDDVVVRMKDVIAMLPHAFADKNELSR
jgi:hypothetical protein